jgi:hypothetical protein
MQPVLSRPHDRPPHPETDGVLVVVTTALHRPMDLTPVGHMLIVVHFCHLRYVKHHDPPLTMLIIENELYRMIRLCYSS